MIQEPHLGELVAGLDAALTRHEIAWTDLAGLKNGLARSDGQLEAKLVSLD